ncbi:MAG: D-alanyl-D-alanine carboxypeptidase family protein [Candidatus Puniceispirillaceae bacterium]
MDSTIYARFISFVAAFLFIFNVNAYAQEDIQSVAKFAYVTDYGSGRVLMDKDGDVQMKPASMAKIMTTYLTFERIAEGGLSLDDTFVVSERAWKKGGSRTFLNPGSSVTISDLLHGVIIQSGNDAAIVLAEGLSGSEDAFADEMNDKARELGMYNTVFRNATGWPDPELTTTAKDLNILSTALIRDFPVSDYPDLYPIFKIKNFTYNDIKQGNRNPLLYKDDSADGLKTGHTEESGYGLVGSAQRGNQRIVMVLNGMSSKNERAQESRRLMDFMFREFKQYEFFDENEMVDEANVWLGKKAKIKLLASQNIHKVMSRKERRSLKVTVNWSDPVPAPITKGQQIGTISLAYDGQIENIPLIASETVGELGFFDRITEAVKYLIFGSPFQPAG